MLFTRAVPIIALSAWALLGACSASAEQEAPSAGGAASRARVDGGILRTEGGGLIGVLDVQRDPGRPETIRAELIMLQRQVVRDSRLPAVTSQIHEIDCQTGRDRILANVGYDRSGTPLHTYPVETALSLRPSMRPVFDSLCRGNHLADAVARFDSLRGFLDFSDEYGARVFPPGAAYPPPAVVRPRASPTSP
jgi:hypothetical protein